MHAFPVTLLVATLLCTLAAGFLFAFAVVVLPGLRSMSAGACLSAFQVMDRVIQKSDPASLPLRV